MAENLMWISSFIALAAVIIAGLRFILGPTPADRTMALDILTVISISLIVLIAFFAGRVIYLDVAFVYGLLSFIGVVAVARYLEGGL